MLSSLFQKIDLSSFTDEQIVEFGARTLGMEISSLRGIVSSPPGQMVLAALRSKAAEEPPGVFHRCSECGFAEELSIFKH